MSRTTI